MMSLFRMYVDEVGNHDLKHAEDPNQRFLSLTGVMVESEHMRNVVKPELAEMKRRFFRGDPDEPVILHRKDIIDRRGPFKVLRDADSEAEFNHWLLEALTRWDFVVVTVVIDKLAHREQYRVWRHHPYHYCMQVLVERFVLHLDESDARGDVMAESRGGKEDLKLKQCYSRLYSEGTDFVAHEMWQSRLTSRELKVKPKAADIAGLQLADLIAYPSQKHILREKELIPQGREVFGDRIVEILERTKYRRDKSAGAIWGFGKKLLP
ncbi:MAG: hypothetical protein B1H03_00925 [Planctomycetales bacterium 4484_113]|nr:MAG: hypothetical protein B1H03_00925 [Planctomycetales bacterium 4484_113]